MIMQWKTLITEKEKNENLLKFVIAENNSSYLNCHNIGWLVVFFFWHIKLCRLFDVKSIFIQIVLFQTFLIQTIQFSISMQFNSI